MRIDLHMHSTASDGSLPPEAVARAARAGGLDVIALTDHDTVAGVEASQRAAADRLQVIPGIEVSTHVEQEDVHILGYFIDIASSEIERLARSATEQRALRMRAMVERLAELGAPIAFEDVVEAAGPDASNLSRPHLARALVAAGHASSVAHAFDRYIGDTGPAFVANKVISAPGAIAVIHDAGGIAVWAHPRPDDFGSMLDRLVTHGLDGVECYRPRCTPADSNRFEISAREHGLLVTGGSDWHGEWHGPLGDFAVTPDQIETFLARAGM